MIKQFLSLQDDSKGVIQSIRINSSDADLFLREKHIAKIRDHIIYINLDGEGTDFEIRTLNKIFCVNIDVTDNGYRLNGKRWPGYWREVGERREPDEYRIVMDGEVIFKDKDFQVAWTEYIQYGRLATRMFIDFEWYYHESD